MRIRNIHERIFAAPTEEVGLLVDSLSSSADRLWPVKEWPPMRFDRPLQVGASGGHGPIRYEVEEYEPGRLVQFRFTGPKGFHGGHRFEVTTLSTGETRLRHVLEMEVKGSAKVTWPLVYRPLHDALLEDALNGAEVTLGIEPAQESDWSWYVHLLRRILRALQRGNSR